MKEMHAPIAGEMSGHMFFTESFYGHDDALYAAARLLRIIADSGKRIDELLADVPPFVSTPELRIDPDDRRLVADPAHQREHQAGADAEEPVQLKQDILKHEKHLGLWAMPGRSTV